MSAPVTLPARLYRDPAVWQAERTAIFSRAWSFFGLERDVAEPGAWIADEVAGFPLIVVRDREGGLRAFHNVCRHRAGPLVPDGKGVCAGELTCRYHGWRYALDGRLRAATDFGPAEGFDPRALGLKPAAVAVWRGFVFVSPDPSAALDETLAPLERLWAAHGVAPGPATLVRSHEIACNWKTYVENYLEGYHIPVVHPELAAEVDCARYRVTMDGAVAVHEVPTLTGVNEGLWAWLWPNLAFNVYRYGLMIERMRPVGHDRTRLDYLYFYDPAESKLDAVLAASDQLTGQDVEICEAVQRNLNAGVYDTGVLSPRHEPAVAWFQAEVARALAA